MVVKRIGPMSLAKICLALYGIIGLIVGAFVALIALVGAGLGSSLGDAGSAGPFMGMAMGVGAIIVLPIFYGVLGFLVGLISAAVYNVAAGIVGGVELDLQ
jgi:hypothetical protein